MCDFCLVCKIGKICIMFWKFFIVKGIFVEYKIIWEKFLGKNGINVCYFFLEFNWYFLVDDIDVFELKCFMVCNFDQNDISIYGLIFSVSSYYGKNFIFVVIVKNL